MKIISEFRPSPKEFGKRPDAVFTMKQRIADVFAGICLLFENQFNEKNIIVVDDFRGEVVQIGFRTTTVRDIGEM